MRTLRLVIMIAVSSVALSTALASAVDADCIGPTINYPAAEVAAGDIVVVTGYGWGDNCYDTGPPPEDEGSLGNPIANIDIVLMPGEIVVANGNADGQYEFIAEIPIPGDLEPGQYTIETRPESYVETPDPIVVAAPAEAPAPAEEAIVAFGPVDPATADEAEVVEEAAPGVDGFDDGLDDDTSGSFPISLMVLLAGVVAVVAATGVVLVKQRS